MHFEPRDVLRKLEFDKIVDLLVKEALTPMAAEALRDLTPMAEFASIDLSIRETSEYKLTLEKNDRFPIAVFSDIRPELKKLAIENYTLTPESFQQVLRILLTTRDVFRYFSSGQKAEIYPKLYDIVRPLHFDDDLIKAIMSVFDEKGEIRPDASPDLMRIRKETVNKLRELDSRFRQLVGEYRQKGWLAESGESFRNGRRVLAVPAEYKRKIRGIIHDESDTGKTAFIEPDPIIEINNDIFDLEIEERREIFKILKTLSDTIRPYGPAIGQYIEMLIRFDIIQAKAQLAMHMRANMPVLKEKPIIGIRKGYHPLLLLKNRAIQRKTVPFDLRLNHENHILILSGPNAGGKSVAMKSVGLMQLMLQSGLLLPVHELSEFGIFKQIFADIGDQQSLDDDLSTYSSRLQNAKVFLQKADHQTLVLIDEMGSGTDPKPGGAIAEALLRGLYNKGVFGVMTTHYSNLKVFAFRNHGILNGNMHFDKDTLSPTYEMKVGRPGSSYAFEIASKSGLPRQIIDYARSRTGSETAVDDILIELQREKQELEETLAAAKEKEKSLERLVKTYDSLHQDLDLKRKRLKLDQKEFELRQSANMSREVDKVIKQIKEEKNLEKAQQVSAKLKVERTEHAQKVDEINAEVVQMEEKNAPAASAKPLSEGDFARLRSGGAIGQIEQIRGKKATVQLGALRVTVALRELLPAVEPIKQTSTATSTNLQASAGFDSKLDMRGMSQSEAMTVLEKFIDNALLSSASTLHILHGKGNGVLRRIVNQKLKEYGNNIARVYHPQHDAGGDGITLVDLA